MRARLGPAAYAQMRVSTYLATRDWKAQIKVYCDLYRERRDAMIESLATMLPEATWTHPDGGFYVWLTLPEGINSKADAPRAATASEAYGRGRRALEAQSAHSPVCVAAVMQPRDRLLAGVAALREADRPILEPRCGRHRLAFEPVPEAGHP